jgi:ABC-type ATPase involved in cell division
LGERVLRVLRELNRLLGSRLLIASQDLNMMRKAKSVVLRLAVGMVVRATIPAPVAEEAPA